ncbi:hypothetical protein QTV49_000426 [Vibrio vulnificus]|nr:hypothetical protein [Vibrio vulnificus]
MKWELSGKNTVIIEDQKFHVGANWLPAIKEKSGFSRKLKVNNQLISTGTTMGCIIENKSSAQIGSCSKDYLGMPLLAANYFGESSTLYFAKVSEELYWVISFDSDGCIDVADDSDSLMELYPLRSYIREVVDLSEASESFKIINIGDRVYLDDPSLDPRVEHIPLSEEELKSFSASSSKVKRQAGNLKTKIYSAGLLSLGGFGALMYSLVTSLPQEVIDIRDGGHSSAFTAQYNKLKKSFNEISNEEKKAQKMTDERVILLGKEEFSDYVLSRGLSNQEILENVLRIRDVTPVKLKGWSRGVVEYSNDKFIVTYTRDGEYPMSSTYKELDVALVGNLKEKHKVVATAVSLTDRGTKRVYDIIVHRDQGKEYANYLEEKRDFVNAKASVMAQLRQTQQELDSAKREIETVEYSVNSLGIFERRDKQSIGFILDRIEEISSTNKDVLLRMGQLVTDYRMIKPVVPPEHSDRLLGEMGIEQNLYPIFQSTNQYVWSNPVVTRSFPSGVTDEKFKNKKIIKGSTIKLKIIDGVFGVWSVSDVISNPYIFIDGVKVIESYEGSAMEVDISINELNQDFIS